MTGKKLLQRLDEMLDAALDGTFQAQTYDESMLSKIEVKMARFLDGAQLRREQIEVEQGHIRALISDISHQTKTPIANIALYSGLLGEQDLTDVQRNLMKQIAGGAEKLNFLIQSLVKTSRLESGIIKVEPQLANISSLIEAAVAENAVKAEMKHIALTVSDSDAGICAKFDPRWCVEALSNIIDNAIKYTARGGKVTVNASDYEMFARIDVADNGRGIKDTDLTKIFGRFWRAAESADSPGVGIGLYLAREIIVSCGGFIKVESKPGDGSIFSVFLSKV
ncbi:MAG: HAMP domain-containing histidine kinase [Oscillospiraceae bacterium]|nr:HAMP domain-containing histidine kinase [Oscillospiraceae bacterium]